MRAFGVVAEYDPFHTGHAYHLAQTRRQLGEDLPAVAVLSGSWTQRGSCALTDKWTRAALALRGGVDLVLELPFPWAVSSAEGFARGGVEILAASGVVDALSFGSECGDVTRLKGLAACLDSPDYPPLLSQFLRAGRSFAESRELAAVRLVGEDAALLKTPNNNLGVEYLRALNALKSPITPLTVLRKGPSHDSPTAAEGHASASQIRALARRGEWEALSPWVPAGTAEALQRAGVADLQRAERAILARLRTMSEADFAALPDSGETEGLPARLARTARAPEAATLRDFLAGAQTRRYPYARLRRMAVWAFLGLTAEDMPAHPRYLRVLGFNRRGRELLREMKQTAALPILTKPAHIKDMDARAQALFAVESRATDLFGLCFPEAGPCGLDYTTGPVIL